MDICKLYQQQGTTPFPYCLVTVTVTQIGNQIIGECFVLVENGKEFFNGQRLVLPSDGEPMAWLSQVLKQARVVVARMSKAATRGHEHLSPNAHPEQITLIETPEQTLADLGHARRFRAHLKWIEQKSASPRLQAQLRELRLLSGVLSR